MKHPSLLLALAGLTALSLSPSALEITTGLNDYQVVQCDADGTAALSLSGTANETGALEARVSAVQKVIVDWTPVGQAAPEW